MTVTLLSPELRRTLDELARRLGILERRTRPAAAATDDHTHDGTGTDSIVLGENIVSPPIASGGTSLAIGSNAEAEGVDSIVIGGGAYSGALNGMAIGSSAGAYGSESVAVGKSATASNIGCTVIGTSADADEDYGTVVGYNAHADNTDGTALGHNAVAGHIRATAIGPDASTTAGNQVMLGTAIDDVVVPGRLVFGGSTSGLTDSDIPATIARDTEVATAVSDHAAHADPHTGYQKESEKDQNSGYAGLAAAQGTRDGTKFLRDDGTWAAAAGGAHPDLAAHDTLGLATQAELDTHAAAADPHTGYLKESVVSGMAAPTIALGATAAAGVATTAISSDATIDAFDTTAPNVIEPDDAAAVGVINFAARRDHEHGIVTAVAGASEMGADAAEGAATSFSRSDHAHSRSDDATQFWMQVGV